MKSVRFFLPTLMVTVGLWLGLDVQAQDYDPNPNDKLPVPVIDYVSVDHISGEVTIKWDVEITPDVDHFVLYYYDNAYYSSGGHHVFATVPQTERVYKFKHEDLPASMNPMMPDPKTNPIFFRVSSAQTISPTVLRRSVMSFEHRNLQINSQYDECPRSEIKLNWYPYNAQRPYPDPNGIYQLIGWLTNTPPFKPLVSYHLWRSLNGGAYEEIQVLPDVATSYTTPSITENGKYLFYIEAKRSDGETVTSFPTELIIEIPTPPSYIVATGTEYNDEGLAEVSFKLDPDAETYSYEFFGSSLYEYSYVSLGKFEKILNDTTLTDIQKRERTFYYKLEAWHVCMNRYTATSDTTTALWLTVKQEGAENLLFWDPYYHWGGDAQYEIYRKIGDNFEELIETVTDPIDTPTPYIDDLTGVFIDGDICYRVVTTAVSPDANNPDGRSVSNTACIIPESDIWLPQAFKPNELGIDGEYKPFFSYPPQDYIFIAYDRNGAKVFETRNMDEGWNGRLLNGKPASEGVYVYHIKFRTELGRLVEKRGTFILLY